MDSKDSAFRKFKGRKHEWGSARRMLYPLSMQAERILARAGALSRLPFVGITTDGTKPPGLFPIVRTGVSTQPILDATTAFVTSMSAQQKRESCHPIHSDHWRKWLNGEPFVLRHGTILEAMDPAQRELALDILRATLSQRGFEEVRKTMILNEFLKEYTEDTENLGEWLYFISIYGTPSAHQPWGWQIDGHHLVINCFILGDQMVMTPVFMGAEPMVADAGPHAGTRIFSDIQEQAVEMVRALDPAQQDKVILYHSMLRKDLPPERDDPQDGRQKMGAFRDNAVMPYEGIRADELNQAQRDRLLLLIELHIGYMADGHAKVKMADIAEHIDQTWFAWIGGTDHESVFFYKIQSPVIAIEFDHHRGVYLDNPEAERFHGHLIIRTPNGNDYGRALLEQFQMNILATKETAR